MMQFIAAAAVPRCSGAGRQWLYQCSRAFATVTESLIHFTAIDGEGVRHDVAALPGRALNKSLEGAGFKTDRAFIFSAL